MIELGCAPGGWLQILAAEVGESGRVLGVDSVPVDPLESPVRLLELDFTREDAPEEIARALGAPADAVLSDAAPKLTGIRDLDRAAEQELYDAAWRVMERALRPGGALVVKGFPGPEADRFRSALRARFARVVEVRPEAKRTTSKEHYWVARAESEPASRRGGRGRLRRRRRGPRTPTGNARSDPRGLRPSHPS